MRSIVMSALALLMVGASASAALKSQTIDYKQGDTALKGYLVYDDAVQSPRPGVLV